MARIRPRLRSTATYTESNFLRLHAGDADSEGALVTLEHFASAPNGGTQGWTCRTIIDGERMSRADALFIARRYAVLNGIAVIYED